ncbi:MAG TPA: hypothetical protein VIJ14_00140 [Rhabdochlamydiaceae bacterium]
MKKVNDSEPSEIKRLKFKTWEIWVGYYKHEDFEAKEPELLASISCRTFRAACFLFELESTISIIKHIEETDQFMLPEYYRFNYEHETNSNRILGKYYESESEAADSFSQEVH